MRAFDLQVGDLVRERIMGVGNKTRFRTWKVIGIYDNIFTVQSFKGQPNSFQKKDYQLGEVMRVAQ